MIRLQVALHRLLRHALPARVRRLRGADMDATFRHLLQSAQRGPRALLSLWASEALDMIDTGVRLRWHAAFGAEGTGVAATNKTVAGFQASSDDSSTDPNRRGERFDALLLDIKFGMRGLRRDPAFAVAAILTLAIGIGANTTVFSVADAVLFRPLPYEEPNQLAIIYEGRWPAEGLGTRPFFPSVTLANFFDWRERNEVFTDMAHVAAAEARLTGGDEPQYVYTHRVSANFFDVLGVQAARGRAFSSEDSTAGAAPVAVIGDSLWKRAFNGDPGVVGTTIHLDDVPYAIVGIGPSDFSFDNVTLGGTPDLWTTAPLTPEERTDRRSIGFLAVARLREGATLQQAQAEMTGIASALAEEHPQANTDFRTGEAVGVSVKGLHEDAVLHARRFILLSIAAASIVLLIACINVANLLLARGAARQPELAVKAALGAGRGRIARQLLTESALLAALGGAASLLLVRLVITWLLAWGPHPGGPGLLGGSIPLLARIAIDGRLLAVTAGICIMTAVISGVVPALRATAASPPHAAGLGGVSLATARPYGSSLARRLVRRDVFVAVEIALALVLLIGTGLLATTFARLYDIPVGFEPRDALAMSVELPRLRYVTESGEVGTARATWEVRPTQAELMRDLVQRLEATAEVEGGAVIDILPFRSRSAGHSGIVHVEGGVPGERVVDGLANTQDDAGNRHVAMLRVITPGYFAAMQIPLLAGRDITWSDDAGAAGVAIVDRELADWFWPGQSAVGRRLHARVGREWSSLQVVGVVGAVWQDGFSPSAIQRESPPGGEQAQRRRRRPGFLYLPYAQPASAYAVNDLDFITRMNIVVRHRGDKQSVAASMVAALRELEPEAPIVRLESMEASIARSVVDRRFHLLVLGTFSVVALMLALIGVYGVMAFQVGRRVHEIGVRMALGAHAEGVVRMIVGEGFRVALLGALLGIAGAMASTRVLAGWLYGVTPTEPAVFLGLSIAMVGVALLACWIPARRAARVDPMTSLRV